MSRAILVWTGRIKDNFEMKYVLQVEIGPVTAGKRKWVDIMEDDELAPVECEYDAQTARYKDAAYRVIKRTQDVLFSSDED
jgi:hypothetical protein